MITTKHHGKYVGFEAKETKNKTQVAFKIIETDHPDLKRHIGFEFPVKQNKEFGQADFTGIYFENDEALLQEFLIHAWDVFFDGNIEQKK